MQPNKLIAFGGGLQKMAKRLYAKRGTDTQKSSYFQNTKLWLVRIAMKLSLLRKAQLPVSFTSQFAGIFKKVSSSD